MLQVAKGQEPKLSRSQRAADAVTEFCGSWPFIICFSGITIVWMALNTVLVLFGVFDPYPYILLNLFLTVVSTFQSPLIMMSQNRQMERDRDAVRGLHSKLDDLFDEPAKRAMLLEAVAWAYQLAGAAGMDEETLDALSALANGEPFEYNWPVVPPLFVTSKPFVELEKEHFGT